MDKVKFGKTFYNVCLIICVVILLAAFLIFKTKDSSGNILPEEELIQTWIFRYLVSFYMFTFLIPLGPVREYTSGEYVAKNENKNCCWCCCSCSRYNFDFVTWNLSTAQYYAGAMLSAVYILAPQQKHHLKINMKSFSRKFISRFPMFVI